MAFNNETKVGIFTALAVVILIISTFYMGGLTLFQSGYRINVIFDSTSDLKVKAKVKYGGGVNIGKVSKISLTPDYKIDVEVLLNKNRQIKSDAYITVVTSGVMGEKFVNVSGGSDAAEIVKAGDILKGKSGGGIDAAMESINQASAELKDVLKALSSILNGVDKSVAGSVENVNQLTKVTKDIVSNNGPAITKSVANFEKASEDVSAATSNIKEVTAQLNKLVKDIDKSNVPETMSNLNKISAKLDEMVTSLDEAAKKLDKGDGTLSVLLNDKKMAEDLKGIVKELKDNPWKLLWKK